MTKVKTGESCENSIYDNAHIATEEIQIIQLLQSHGCFLREKVCPCGQLCTLNHQENGFRCRRRSNVNGIGIIGGSGLDDPQLLKDVVETHIKTPYGPTSDALLEGKIEGIDCVILARHGRNHSLSPTNVNYRANIWALKKIGCTHVIVSTATGSLREEIAPGDLVVIDSFIDRTKHRVLTFFDGSTDEFPGVCHIPMEPAFCEDTRKVLINVAKQLNLNVHESGTAISIEGPRFSTKAESNLYRSWGASLVNMTLVPEVILAKEAGLSYAAVAIATDYDCWRGSVVDVDEVEAAMKKYAKNIKELFLKAIPAIAKLEWEPTIAKLKCVVEKSNMHKEKK